ncbi:MAG TPA: DUF402 domain-containing protein [Polyangia bacterium]
MPPRSYLRRGGIRVTAAAPAFSLDAARTTIIPSPSMDVNALPHMLETKRSLSGPDKTFACRVLARAPGTVTVLFVSGRVFRTADLTLPVGTVTFGHFWVDRPYNVYHWLRGPGTSDAGTTIALYMNLSDETRIDGEHLAFRDLAVDVLARPGHPLIVLDEDELPPNLDPALRDYIDRGVARVQSDLLALVPELERAADRHWLQLFGATRA